MDNLKLLDSVSKQEKKEMLVNHISPYMIQHNMTIENLDDAVNHIKELYRKNAIMKG